MNPPELLAAVMSHGESTAPNVHDLLASHLSGESLLRALEQAVNRLARLAPEDHDVLLQAFDLTVTEVVFHEPDALLFCGLDHQGQHIFALCHYTQAVVRVFTRPRALPVRVITGFSRGQ